MKRGKATGGDQIAVEMIIALKEFVVEKLTNFANKFYCAGMCLEESSKSISVHYQKKTEATECELHRTISLMSHITKILLGVILIRARSKVRPEISEEQDGFMEDRGTRNAIFMMRSIAERAIECKETYMFVS